MLKRALEWMTRREALARAMGRSLTLDPTQRAHLARARSIAALAERVLGEGERAPEADDVSARASARQVAVSLYREAAHWGLAARSTAAAADLPSAFEAAPTEFLRESAGGEAALASVKTALVARSFVDTAGLDERALEGDLRSARSFVGALLIDGPTRIRALRRERWTRSGLAVITCVALFEAGAWLKPRMHRDLGAHGHWRTSSAAYGFAAEGTDQHQPDPTVNAFFHTTEMNAPWIEFDLGRATPVGFVEVLNRRECCFDRAVPLVLEVAVDHERWAEVARRTDIFYDWSVTFARRPVRYLRLRTPRTTSLHLERVSIR